MSFQQTKVNLKLPFSFILSSMIALVVSQWILFQNVDLIAEGYYRTPALWMAFHLLILGFAVMVVMGAMYQLVPVAFLTPIWSERFGFVQFGVTIAGVLALSVLLGFNPGHAVYGGALAILGIIMFMFQMFMTIRKQKEKNMMTWLVTGALVFFLLTILAGFLLAWNLSNGEILNHESLLRSHLLFGVAGWFTLLIFGFSYKLVPMFSLSHGYSMKWAKPAFIIYIAGMLVLVNAFWSMNQLLQTTGWFLLFMAFTLFLLDIREILAKRSKKRLDRPFLFAMISVYFGWVIHFLTFIVSILLPGHSKIWGLLIYLYLVSWVLFSILGYLKKIVPVLWWTLKYADRVGKEKVPMLKDLIREKSSVIIYSGIVAATFGNVIAVLFNSVTGLQVFQGIWFLFALAFSISIGRILTK
ncbi:hypothetical protein GWK91_01560 [Virgibacillus sp. MSP4-1]|uniref:hypothetical protein n=1 Tax=Virgibacillus sp. MSP4-1 TaxID=2700081 RepID=UPI0003A67128|nr:hypothetical protein [Virgibacillus sp. MSP4-1]QHS21716.1 hypothetical protein GWK91_01560 [Virgibacillus sp. MSP4-1]